MIARIFSRLLAFSLPTMTTTVFQSFLNYSIQFGSNEGAIQQEETDTIHPNPRKLLFVCKNKDLNQVNSIQTAIYHAMFLFSKSASVSSSLVALLLVLETPRGTQGLIIPKKNSRQLDSAPLFRNSGRKLTTITSALFATEDTKTLEVCLSPGCVADGAETTLLKLKALSPSCSNLEVTQGVCCSLCGNGPVAIDPKSGKKHRKITTNKKIIDLLQIETMDPNQEAVLKGIDLCLLGDQDLKRKNYKGAAQNYAKGIEKGMTAAIALGSNDDTTVALEWVVKALCNEGHCKLKFADIDGAIVSAGTAYQLSQKTSSESLEVVQEAYEAKKEKPKELGALQALFVLYEQEEEAQKGLKPSRRKKITPMEANKRRNLEFRLSQLEATVKT